MPLEFEMGCTPIIGTYELGPMVMVSHYACDLWAAPHFLVPFLVTVWTRSWLVGAFFAPFGEVLEYFVYWAFRSFVIFLGTQVDQNLENLVGTHIDDVAWMGWLCGVSLGTIYYMHFYAPRLVTLGDVWGRRVLRFLFYSFLLFVLCVAVPAFTHEVDVGSFHLGRLLYPIYHGIAFLLAYWFQPSDTWRGYTKLEQRRFWLIMWIISAVVNVQNMFDWFYSSHIQVSLIVGIFAFILTVWSQIQWKWFQRIELSFDFYY